MICDCQNRLKVKRGTDLPQAKLTDDDVRNIRAQYAIGQEAIRTMKAQFSAASFAKRFGVHVRTLEKVLRYETWVYVL